MKYVFSICLFSLCNIGFSQTDSAQFQKMDTISLNGKLLSFQNRNLYDIQEEADKENINGFYALNIFNENIDKQVWASPEKNCVQFSPENTLVFEGKNALHVNWDKITGGCKWAGMGFGWDNWRPKDISAIIETAGIEIHFYSPGTDLNNLPLAFALEDYSGSQAYVGYAPKYLTSSKIKANTWNSFILPLKDFPFTATQTDPGNTKQFIIQFEADGNIIFDKIKIVSLNKK
jgi:hypothetical protein